MWNGERKHEEEALLVRQRQGIACPLLPLLLTLELSAALVFRSVLTSLLSTQLCRPRKGSNGHHIFASLKPKGKLPVHLGDLDCLRVPDCPFWSDGSIRSRALVHLLERHKAKQKQT